MIVAAWRSTKRRGRSTSYWDTPSVFYLEGDQESSCHEHERWLTMADQSTVTRNPFTDIAPALAEYTDRVLFGDVWQRSGLSPRDRSLITVATLVALYRTNELPGHLKKALDNGISRDELIELITHLAFYSGWPTAATAVTIASRVFEERGV
jgi:4-carboxymuconolactone decarboxylase